MRLKKLEKKHEEIVKDLKWDVAMKNGEKRIDLLMEFAENSSIEDQYFLMGVKMGLSLKN